MTPKALAPLAGPPGVRAIQDLAPDATPEQRYGGAANPAHGVPGQQATPYPWEQFPGEGHGPYGIENELLGDVCLTSPAGTLNQDPTASFQPITRAAPWPKGTPQSPTPDAQAPWREQENAIHGISMGTEREALYVPTADPTNDQWVEMWEVNPGESNQVKIPDQLKGSSGGWGSTDRVQSDARQNAYGFDSAHMHRRYADGAIPGNFMWMQPGARPLRKTISRSGRVYGNGQDSPFAGQSGALGYDAQGSALADLPVAYQAAPDVATVDTYDGDGVTVGGFW